jgi:glycyl-tRNA synthetase
MMFRVGVGAIDESAYLRPETCQSIFVDFPRLFKIMRGKLPFPIAQLGKSFRNEISPRQSLMRLREFYQAEIEVFYNLSRINEFEKFEEISNYVLRFLIDTHINEISCEEALKKNIIPNKLVGYYLAIIQQFYEKAGIDLNKLRLRKLTSKEKAFYARSAFDLEIETSLGWIELVACNDRGDYDLKRHMEVSKKDMTVIDGDDKILPNIFELSMGVDRSLYCIMEHSFIKENDRNILKVNRYLSPVQVGIFPLLKKESLQAKAKEIQNILKGEFQVFYDESGSIGRRYRRQDEVGTPLGITIDYDTLNDNEVTLRNRDDMDQKRVKITELLQIIRGYFLDEDNFR